MDNRPGWNSYNNTKEPMQQGVGTHRTTPPVFKGTHSTRFQELIEQARKPRRASFLSDCTRQNLSDYTRHGAATGTRGEVLGLARFLSDCTR